MKFICTLPEEKHYQSVQSPTPGKYVWVDKGSSLIRITTPIPNPWGQKWEILPSIDKAKNDTYQYPNRLILRCFALNENNIDTPQGKLEREIMRGKFAYSVNSPSLFFCFPVEANEQTYNRSPSQRWLIYSFYSSIDFKLCN